MEKNLVLTQALSEPTAVIFQLFLLNWQGNEISAIF